VNLSEFSIISAFLLGLASTLHCVGMCGGIIGALSFGLPEHIRSHRWRVMSYVSAYNIGRVTSYGVIGALMGFFGAELFASISPDYGHRLLSWLAAIIMLGIGLYLAGAFPWFVMIEKLGAPLWTWLEPAGKKLLPVKTPAHAMLFGMIWGWLPCGMVYAALAWATASGSAVDGLQLMLAFGVGTLPATLTAGIFAGWFTVLARKRILRVVAGVTIIVMAVWLTWSNEFSGVHDHSQHDMQDHSQHEHSSHSIAPKDHSEHRHMQH